MPHVPIEYHMYKWFKLFFNWRTEFFPYPKFENETIFVPWRLPTRSCWLAIAPATCQLDGNRPWQLAMDNPSPCSRGRPWSQFGGADWPSVDGNQKSPRPTHRPWMYKKLLWILGISTTSIWWCSRISTSPNCEDGSFTMWQTNIGKQSIAHKKGYCTHS